MDRCNASAGFRGMTMEALHSLHNPRVSHCIDLPKKRCLHPIAGGSRYARTPLR